MCVLILPIHVKGGHVSYIISTAYDDAKVIGMKWERSGGGVWQIAKK